jgi:hypothetical protein
MSESKRLKSGQFEIILILGTNGAELRLYLVKKSNMVLIKRADLLRFELLTSKSVIPFVYELKRSTRKELLDWSKDLSSTEGGALRSNCSFVLLNGGIMDHFNPRTTLFNQITSWREIFNIFGSNGKTAMETSS